MAAAGFRGELVGTPPGLPWQRLQDLTPETEVGGEPIQRQSVRTLLDEPDADWAVRQIRRNMPRLELQRTEMRKAFAFFDGDQVPDSDKSSMEMSGRPVIQLNEVQKFIRIVDGLERRAPLTIYYLARNPDDPRAGFKAEAKSLALEWVKDSTFYGFEVARAKRDRLICGLGFTEQFVDRKRNPAGVIPVKRFSPLEAIYPSCSAECFDGIRWIGRRQKMAVDAAIQKWPHVADILTAAAGGSGAPKDYPVKVDLVKYRVPWIMTEPTNKGSYPPPDPEEVAVTHFQYTKGTEGYWFKDPILDQFKWLSTKEFEAYSRNLSKQTGTLARNAEKVIKDVCWRLFLLNDTFVLSGPEEMPIDGFSINVVTGDYDEKRKLWYGLMRIFFDPQLLIDKLASSAVEIIGSQNKNGLDIETGTMDPNQEKEYKAVNAIPSRILHFKRNAIAEGRTRYVTPAPIPEGITTMLQFGIKEMDNLTTLVQSLLTAQESTGVGLRQRITIGLLFLAGYFDSSARFERNQADTTQKYLALIADDRWVRIGGPGSEQYVQLAKYDFDEMLDITIDDTERDPTLRRLWMDYMVQLTPPLAKLQMFSPDFLDVFQGMLPQRMLGKWKQFIQQKSEMDQQMRMMGLGQPGRGKQRTPEEVKAETALTQGKAAVNFAKAQHLRAQAKDTERGDPFNGLKDLMDVATGIHQADLEERRHRLEQAKTGADLIKAMAALRQQGQGKSE